MIEIKKDKRIGDVIFILEGDRTEFDILKHIFTRIFNYNFVAKKRVSSPFTNIEKYQGIDGSCIVMVNSVNSTLKSIIDMKQYLDIGEVVFDEYVDETIYELQKTFNVSIDKATTFYIFDRDPKTNTEADIKIMLDILKNPYENDNNLEGGMLLLSYPSFESFIISNFEKESYKSSYYLGQELKPYRNTQGYMTNKINENTLKNAVEEFLGYLEQENIEMIFNENEDNLHQINLRVNENQELFFEKNSKYQVFSLFVECLLYLGVVSIK